MPLLQNIPPRNALFFGGLILVLYGLYFFIVQLPSNTQNSITSSLSAMGFAPVRIEKIDHGFFGIRANNISLDAYGIDSIRSIDVKALWPLYIFGAGISSVQVDGVHITKKAQDLQLLATGSFQKILNLPDYKFTLTDGAIDITTSYGDIRLTGELTATPTRGHQHAIKARLLANQYQMGFQTSWQGVIDNKKNFDLYAEVLDGRFHAASLAIARASGWANISNSAQEGLQSQLSLVAGGANLNGLPLQALSLQAQTTQENTDVVLRSGVSGLPDILFAADIANTPHTQESTIVFQGENLGRFLQSMEKAQATPAKIPGKLAKTTSFSLKAQLQPERRFAKGPAPYSLSLSLDQAPPMKGTFLFYADTMEARGSLEVDADYADALARYFKIPKENVNNNFLRLDGSLSSWVSKEKRP